MNQDSYNKFMKSRGSMSKSIGESMSRSSNGNMASISDGICGSIGGGMNTRICRERQPQMQGKQNTQSKYLQGPMQGRVQRYYSEHENHTNDQDAIIPMDSGTYGYSPFDDFQAPPSQGMNHDVKDTQNTKRFGQGGVAFRGFSDGDRDLDHERVMGLSGDEHFSFRQTIGDGSTTNTPVGDWDFEEDQKINMNGLVNNIYNEKNENGSMFLQQFEKNQRPSLKNIKTNKDGHIYESSLLSGNMSQSPVSDLFFSKTNLQALQDGIRYSVYNLSGGRHVIGEQSNEELVIIMKTMFLTHGKNLMYNVVEQVRELNKKVLDHAVPDVIEQLDMYNQYRHDKAFLPTPIDRSVSTTKKGERSLEMNGFF